MPQKGSDGEASAGTGASLELGAGTGASLAPGTARVKDAVVQTKT